MAILKINGIEVKPPKRGYSIQVVQYVDSGRNANGAVVGQIIGRECYKINNLEWNGISGEEGADILSTIDNFRANVTFIDPKTNNTKTVTMYRGDIDTKPLFVNDDGTVSVYEYIKFNLIDCGLL